MVRGMRNFVFLLVVGLVFGGKAVYSQENEMSKLKADLVSAWLVTVEGENRTRTLKIKGVAQKDVGSYLLDSDYGMTDEKQSAVKSEVTTNAGERKLIIVTQASTLIETKQGIDGNFTGTFTLKNGKVKSVVIKKLSEEELKEARELAMNNAAPSIKPPAADVPANCAAFVGGWLGEWPGLAGNRWLWVVSVNQNCSVKYSYGASAKVPTKLLDAEIKNGVLTVLRSPGAMTFEVNGDTLRTKYEGSDGTNSTTFKKVNLTDGSLEKLRAEQDASSKITPPGPDVPQECAVFGGKWEGNWSQGGIGTQRLTVHSIDTSCKAAIRYSGVLETVEIKGGELKWVCNKSTNGTCVLSHKSGDLWANYSNPQGGTNNAVFKRVP